MVRCLMSPCLGPFKLFSIIHTTVYCVYYTTKAAPARRDSNAFDDQKKSVLGNGTITLVVCNSNKDVWSLYNCEVSETPTLLVGHDCTAAQPFLDYETSVIIGHCKLERRGKNPLFFLCVNSKKTHRRWSYQHLVGNMLWLAMHRFFLLVVTGVLVHSSTRVCSPTCPN